LAALSREKTKEILALERLLHCREEQQSSTQVSVTRLMSENKELQERYGAGALPVKLPPDSPRQPLINPAFLGQ
jgi:hypothetical protein